MSLIRQPLFRLPMKSEAARLLHEGLTWALLADVKVRTLGRLAPWT